MKNPPAIDCYVNQMPWTPLVGLRWEGSRHPLWCKLEFLNPSGSTKDRIATYILSKALRRGELAEGGTVVEASSGSTSIAMALTCAQLGLRFVAVMPEGVSNERLMIIRAYGGEVMFSSRSEGIAGSLALARQIAAERGAFEPRQFENPDNAQAHRLQTAREIMAQIPGGRVDAVVSGVGTGGTLVGLSQGFDDFGNEVVPVLARPISGRAFPDAECCRFSPRIPGVVEGQSRLFRSVEPGGLIEIEVDDDEALEMTRALIRRGYPVGPSSGLNVRAALLARERLGPDAVIVTVLPDRMERYFSTELFTTERPIPLLSGEGRRVCL